MLFLKATVHGTSGLEGSAYHFSQRRCQAKRFKACRVSHKKRSGSDRLLGKFGKTELASTSLLVWLNQGFKFSRLTPSCAAPNVRHNRPIQGTDSDHRAK